LTQENLIQTRGCSFVLFGFSFDFGFVVFLFGPELRYFCELGKVNGVMFKLIESMAALSKEIFFMEYPRKFCNQFSRLQRKMY